MFYVGVCHYYATGEGFKIYVASGSEESIRKAIPEYFHQRLTLLTPSEWLKASIGESKYHQSDVKVLKTYLPVLWKQIEERALGRGCQLNFFMEYHFNYA
ncbi:hypothetical protein CEQ50_08615 [Vibrio anguillarum]|uniref:hypothetical protein n=1 Tax=Vibrio anguillarum TaxID=55601 RepID=UPI000B53D382|nr:hypothetical protein [Vibrio anguillarum]ASG07618.1 hypothetical protein CEQ50_08615 [Vibrio anguillarum]